MGLAFAVCLPFVVPKVDSTKREKKPEKKPLIPSGGKGSLTVKGVFSVSTCLYPVTKYVLLNESGCSAESLDLVSLRGQRGAAVRLRLRRVHA